MLVPGRGAATAFIRRLRTQTSLLISVAQADVQREEATHSRPAAALKHLSASPQSSHLRTLPSTPHAGDTGHTDL